MIGLGALAGGAGYSASSGASSGSVGYNPTLGGFGGIQTGGTQGVSLTMLAVIAGAVIVALLVLKR